eukprot:COSAG05_NODE_962_length_6414_cov_4.358353_6_plen_50_part_00
MDCRATLGLCGFSVTEPEHPFLLLLMATILSSGGSDDLSAATPIALTHV